MWRRLLLLLHYERAYTLLRLSSWGLTPRAYGVYATLLYRLRLLFYVYVLYSTGCESKTLIKEFIYSFKLITTTSNKLIYWEITTLWLLTSSSYTYPWLIDTFSISLFLLVNLTLLGRKNACFVRRISIFDFRQLFWVLEGFRVTSLKPLSWYLVRSFDMSPCAVFFLEYNF